MTRQHTFRHVSTKVWQKLLQLGRWRFTSLHKGANSTRCRGDTMRPEDRTIFRPGWKMNGGHFDGRSMAGDNTSLDKSENQKPLSSKVRKMYLYFYKVKETYLSKTVGWILKHELSSLRVRTTLKSSVSHRWCFIPVIIPFNRLWAWWVDCNRNTGGHAQTHKHSFISSGWLTYHINISVNILALSLYTVATWTYSIITDRKCSSLSSLLKINCNHLLSLNTSLYLQHPGQEVLSLEHRRFKFNWIAR